MLNLKLNDFANNYYITRTVDELVQKIIKNSNYQLKD